jgi:hypothetical protein
MAAKKADMQRLIEERDKLLAQIEALRNKVAGLELAMALLDTDDSASVQQRIGSRRGKVKDVVLDLLEAVGTTGLNAASAINMANQRGVALDRGSVSSLLSRLKHDGIVEYDGDRYRLPKFVERPPENPSEGSSSEGHVQKLRVLER